MSCQRTLVEESSLLLKSSPRTPGSLSTRLNGDTWTTKSFPKSQMMAVSMTEDDEEDLKQAEEEADDEEADEEADEEEADEEEGDEEEEEEEAEEDQEEMECDEEQAEAEDTSDKSSAPPVWGGTIVPGEKLTWEGDDENLKLAIKSVCLTDAEGGDDVVVGVTVGELTRHPIASFTPGKTSMATMNVSLSGPVTLEVISGNGTVHVLGNVSAEPDNTFADSARTHQDTDDEETDEDYMPESDEEDDESEDEYEDESDDIDLEGLSGSDDDVYYSLSEELKAKFEAQEREAEAEHEDESGDDEEDEDNESAEENTVEDDGEEDEAEEEGEEDEEGEEAVDVEDEEAEEVEADEDEVVEDVEAEDENDDNVDGDENEDEVEAEEEEEKETADEEVAEQEEDDGNDSDASISRYRMTENVPLQRAMETINESLNLADHENSLSRKRKTCPSPDEEDGEESEGEDGAKKRRKSVGSQRLRQSRTPSFEIRSYDRE